MKIIIADISIRASTFIIHCRSHLIYFYNFDVRSAQLLSCCINISMILHKICWHSFVTISHFFVHCFWFIIFCCTEPRKTAGKREEGNSLNLTAYNQALANGNVLFCCRQNRCDRVIATRSIHNKTCSAAAIPVAVAVPSFCI